MPAPGILLAGRYRIVAPLGAGGMATVHRARDERLEREVAVKILLPNHAGDPILAARFEREARSLAAAAHPGVVAVFDVDPGDAAAGVEPFFVMELCPGGSLADRLEGGQRLGPDELIPIIISVADGLAGLHAGGVVHRDVKPSNILLALARAKLADFGLARSDDPASISDLTAPGTAVGTMGYLAPDVLAGETAGPPGDVYALGVAVFAGLTGSMPRRAGSIAELVAAGGQPPPLVSSAAPDLGTAFDEPVAAALDPDPAKRPDAASLAASLTSALGRWSRARPGLALAGERTAADPFATTAVVPIESPALRDAPPATPRSAPAGLQLPPARASRRNLVAAAAIGGLVVAAFALAASRGQESGRPEAAGASSAAVQSASSSPASASLSASAAPPTPVPTASVTKRALAALNDVDAAIAAAGGQGGLKEKDAKDLERRADEIRTAIDQGDLDAAAKAADGLSSAVGRADDKMGEDQARRLNDAVNNVVAILNDR